MIPTLDSMMTALAVAQQAPAGAAGPAAACGGGGGASSLIMMVLMFAVFYFLLIRPQQKKQKELETMLSSLKKGDTIVTRGGMIARVTGVQDNILIVEPQEKVRVRILRAYVDRKWTEAGAQADKADRARGKDADRGDRDDRDQKTAGKPEPTSTDAQS